MRSEFALFIIFFFRTSKRAKRSRSYLFIYLFIFHILHKIIDALHSICHVLFIYLFNIVNLLLTDQYFFAFMILINIKSVLVFFCFILIPSLSRFAFAVQIHSFTHSMKLSIHFQFHWNNSIQIPKKEKCHLIFHQCLWWRFDWFRNRLCVIPLLNVA